MCICPNVPGVHRWKKQPVNICLGPECASVGGRGETPFTLRGLHLSRTFPEQARACRLQEGGRCLGRDRPDSSPLGRSFPRFWCFAAGESTFACVYLQSPLAWIGGGNGLVSFTLRACCSGPFFFRRCLCGGSGRVLVGVMSGAVVGASVDDSGVVVYVRPASELRRRPSSATDNAKVMIEFETRPSRPARLCSPVWGKETTVMCPQQTRAVVTSGPSRHLFAVAQGPPPSCSTRATMALSDDDVWRCRQHAHLGDRLPPDPWER